MNINLPDEVKNIISRLESAGHEAYAVGGCVRDSLMGKTPHDWDLTTSALPDEIETIFSDFKLVTVGKRFGTIAVIQNGVPYEITTFRVDGEYTDSRHPDEVRFTPRLSDDLSRRDFTVNAMAFSERTGLVDLFGGEEDLRFGVIRCVGDPEERFSEDALRILRALRFAAVFGFSIEPFTQSAALKRRNTLNEIAAERIRVETVKLLCAQHPGTILRRFKQVFAVFIPELSATFGFEQDSVHHNRDVFRHTVAAVENIEPSPTLRLTMLFHDIGKPLSRTVDADGQAHYKGHPTIGSAMTDEIMRRLHFSNSEIYEVTTLIKHHDDRLKPDGFMLKKYLETLGADMMRKLLKVQRADILAQSMYKREEKIQTLDTVSAEVERIIQSGECYNLKMLAVSGKDLIRMGVKSGEEIGVILKKILREVMKGNLENEKETLLSFAKEMIRMDFNSKTES